MVEWKPLQNIVKSISTGLNPRQNFVLNEDNACYYYVTVKEITTNKVVFSDSTDRITKDAKSIINNRSKLEKGDILFSGIGTIGKVAYVDFPTSNWDCSESVFVVKPQEKAIPGKFLSYILSSNIAKNQYEKGAAGAIMKGVRKATLENILIPIPSLSEQQRIVGILDTFTASIDNLKEQIAQRRKQYEYYRDQLLDLEGKPGVEMKTLGEVCKKTNNIKWKQESSNKEYKYIDLSSVCIENNQIEGTVIINKENAPSRAQQVVNLNDVLLGTTRPTLKRYCQINEQYDNQICSTGYCVFRANKSIVLSRWIYHNIGAPNFWDYCEANQKGAGYPCLSNSDAFAYSIPVPSLHEQQRIVSILDTFEASIQNLDAQLKQREKQYEYYRNKLLTFE